MPICCRIERDPTAFSNREFIQHKITSQEQNRRHLNFIPSSVDFLSKTKIRHKKRRARFVDNTGKEPKNDIDSWFVALLSRIQEDNDNDNEPKSERTSIRLTTCVTDVFKLQDKDKDGKMHGWNIVFVLGPLNGAQTAISVSQKLSTSQKGIVSKVARGEALANILGVSGFADWTFVFGCDISYLQQ